MHIHDNNISSTQYVSVFCLPRYLRHYINIGTNYILVGS